MGAQIVHVGKCGGKVISRRNMPNICKIRSSRSEHSMHDVVEGWSYVAWMLEGFQITTALFSDIRE